MATAKAVARAPDVPLPATGRAGCRTATARTAAQAAGRASAVSYPTSVTPSFALRLRSASRTSGSPSSRAVPRSGVSATSSSSGSPSLSAAADLTSAAWKAEVLNTAKRCKETTLQGRLSNFLSFSAIENERVKRGKPKYTPCSRSLLRKEEIYGIQIMEHIYITRLSQYTRV